jgi:hypothetical protein
LQAQQRDSGGAAAAVSGSGKTDFIPIWINSTTLSSSTLFEKSENVGIATTAPSAKLEVNGTAKFDQAVTFTSGQTFPGTAGLGSNSFSASQNVTGNVTASATVQGGVVNATTSFDLGGSPFAFGSVANFNAFLGFAGNSTMTGGGDTAVGVDALLSNTTGSNNTAYGVYALLTNTTGQSNTAIGEEALYQDVTGGWNTAVGLQALVRNTEGNYNTATGWEALESNTTGNFSTASGVAALQSSTGNENTSVGYGALGRPPPAVKTPPSAARRWITTERAT